jgi:iduronate 2-sulfatase
MKSFPRLVLALAIAILAMSTSVIAAEKTNVLFIICDDLNCDLGVYGHPQVKSPNIDQLAKNGMMFRKAYCQFPVCGASRASFMTGLYPDQTLIRGNAILLRSTLPDVQSMSQMFIRSGYQATRIGKIYHYNVPADIGKDGHDDPQSWTHKINPRGRDKTDESKVVTLRKGAYGGTLSWLAADGTDEEQTDGIAAAHAVRLLKEYSQQKTPFFMAVGLYRPHTPYVAPKKYFELYPKDKIVVPTVPDGYFETLPRPAQQSLLRKKDQVNLKDDLARSAIQAYYASITFADAQIGKILDQLKATGLDKNTVVVFTSDHGYHMGEHGHYQKTTLFENADRVPLIISAPGMKARGRQTESIAEMIDFYPTLAELCGLKPPTNLSGVSLTTILDDPTAKPRADALTLYASGYGLRTQRYRYNEWGEDGSQGAELYDHQTDPEELVNLANSTNHEQIIAELSERIQERIKEARTVPKGLKQIPRKPRKPRKK